MKEIDKECRWGPLWRKRDLLGNAARWVAASALTGLLVLALTLTWKPLIEQQTRRGGPQALPTDGIGWEIVRDEAIAAPFYWVIDGERVDRTPQISPDGTKVAYLPTVDGRATAVDRLVARDLATGQEPDLTPEQGYSYTSVRWSPDSRSLAFVKHRYVGGQVTPTEVWRIDADGRNLKLLYRPLLDLTDVRGPAVSIIRWSTDGRYLQLSPTIWAPGGPLRLWQRVRADGGGEESQIEPTAAWFGASEDALIGETVYSPTQDYALHVVRTAGLRQKPQNAPEAGHSLVLYDLKARKSAVFASMPGVIYLSDAGLAPDGEWILFTTVVFPESGPPSEAARVWVVRRDGTDLCEITSDGRPLLVGEGPIWASGGRAYFSQPRVVSALWIREIDAASGQTGLITNHGPYQVVSASRDGRRLLAIHGEWEQAQLRLFELVPAAAPTPAPLGASPERIVIHNRG